MASRDALMRLIAADLRASVDPASAEAPAGEVLARERAAFERVKQAEGRLRAGLSSGQVDLIDHAIALFAAALSDHPPRFHATTIVAGIADCLRQRHEFSRDPADLADAVALFGVLEGHLDARRFEDRDQLNAQAAAFVDMFFASGEERTDVIESALRLADDLCEHGMGDPAPWRYQNTLSAALNARYTSTGRISDLRAAVQLMEEIVEGVPRDHPDRPVVLFNLAEYSIDLDRIDRDPVRVRSAQSHLEDALKLPAADSEYLRPRLQMLLAEALVAHHVGDPPVGRNAARRAVTSAQAALASALRSGLERERCRVAYANSLVALYHSDGNPELLKRAAAEYRNAVEEVDSRSPNAITYRCGLATCLRRIAEVTSKLDDQIAGTAAFRAIWGDRLEPGSPSDLVFVALEWGVWALDRGADDEAVEALRHGIEALRATLPVQHRRQHKEAWLNAARELPILIGFALARQHDGKESARAVEAGRAVLLAEAAHGHVAGSAASRDVGQDLVFAIDAALDPDWTDIETAATTTTVCYLCPTRWGGFVALVTREAEPVVLLLPALTTEAVCLTASALREALAAVIDPSGRAARGVIECCEWAWRVCMRDVHSKLVELDADGVLLIPAGELADLPLHAAGSQGKFVLDDVAVSYAPSARSVLPPGDVDRTPGPRSPVLLVDEPRPVAGEPLRYSGAEVATIQRIASDAGSSVIDLPHESATREAVLTGLQEAGAAHFSGHAVAAPDQPDSSHLQVAPMARITADELRDITMPGRAVVTLSACESAVVGRALPEEAIGIPSALLQAGASAVVATMWEVRDTPVVAYLFARFYDEWLAERRPPGRALAAAVRWVRTSQRDAMALAYPLIEPQLSEDPVALEFLSSRQASPDEWAAFVYVGI